MSPSKTKEPIYPEALAAHFSDIMYSLGEQLNVLKHKSNIPHVYVCISVTI